MTSPLDFLSRPSAAPSSSRRLPAWLLPVSILTGFGLLFGALFRDRLLPAPAVTVAPVLATSDAPALVSRNDAVPAAAAPLFQASGWVEPEPYPVKASALIDGVVATVHVLEGEDVEKDQLLVSLVDEDARLALAAAEARQQLLLSARTAHLSAIEGAKRKHAAAQAETVAAKTRVAEADDQKRRLDRLVVSQAVSEADAISARLRLEREQSGHLAAQAREAELAAEVERMVLETAVKESEITQADVMVEQARLALARTQIRSPIQGRVLRLLAAPGDKKMLGMDPPDSSTVCILYEPDRLQVRVDVPLADAAGLFVGQQTRIHTSLLSSAVFQGEVIRVAGEADLQRNTLQAKVRLLRPADQLRPEMLCRVEFFGEAGPSASGPAAATALALWLPTEALRKDKVWVCDPDSKRLTLRSVVTAGETRDQHVRVMEGLRPGEWVVLTPGDWQKGQRVHPKMTTP